MKNNIFIKVIKRMRGSAYVDLSDHLTSSEIDDFYGYAPNAFDKIFETENVPLPEFNNIMSCLHGMAQQIVSKDWVIDRYKKYFPNIDIFELPPWEWLRDAISGRKFQKVELKDTTDTYIKISEELSKKDCGLYIDE